MEEKQLIQDAVAEIKLADENELKKTIETWFEKTRTDGLRLGAYYISAGVFAAIQKHTKKTGKVSLRDYERMTNDILKIVSVQLKQDDTMQNDLENEEVKNDGTAE